MAKKHTIIKLILSILSTLLIIFAIVFFLKIIKNKNRHTSAALITLQEKMEKKEKEIIFFEKSEEIKTIQNSINNYFVRTEEIDTFVNYLEDLGVDIGSKIIVKEIKSPENEKNIIEFQLIISGSFDQVSKTIIILENIHYDIDIKRVYFNKQINNDEEKGLVNSTWEANIIFSILSLN